MDFRHQKAAMFVAHPGHVLRAFHWMEIAKPVVFVMTDGSGPDQPARLPSTTTLLDKVGARQGAIYGRWTDAQVYEAILNRDGGRFVAATREFADALVAEEVDYVVGDAAEGYQCTHELCRYVVNSAIALVEKETGRRIANYGFLLFGPPDACPEELRDRAIRVDLGAAAMDRKIAAAESYSPDFTHEVTQQVEKYGREPFKVEYLLPVDADRDYNVTKPLYEVYGELQVISGKYKNVIRYSDHFEPLVDELRARLGLCPAAVE